MYKIIYQKDEKMNTREINNLTHRTHLVHLAYLTNNVQTNE